MGAVYVFDFGVENGVQTFRINGSKSDLEKIVETCIDENAKFGDTPILNHVYKSDYSLLLKLRLVSGRWD